jgi:hypothetical protein
MREGNGLGPKRSKSDFAPAISAATKILGNRFIRYDRVFYVGRFFGKFTKNDRSSAFSS